MNKLQKQKAGTELGWTAGGAAGGAAAGAAIGSIIPGLGTLVGAGIGAIVVGAVGRAAGKKLTESMQEDIDELEAALEHTMQSIKEALGIAIGDFAAGLRGAFREETYQDFLTSLRRDMTLTVVDALVEAFMAGRMMRGMLETVSDIAYEIVEAAFDSDGNFLGLDADLLEQFEDQLTDIGAFSEEFYQAIGVMIAGVLDTAEAFGILNHNMPSGFKTNLRAYEAGALWSAPVGAGGSTLHASSIPSLEAQASGGMLGAQSVSSDIHIHGDVYGYDDFVDKVGQAVDDRDMRRNLGQVGRRASR